KWFEIAEQEERGIKRPREEHERAIKNMAEFIQTWTYGENVDDYVHTAIVAFLEAHTPPGGLYADGFVARQVAEHITDEELRFRFAWRHVAFEPADDWGRFSIVNERDLTFVDWIQEQARERGLSQQIDAKA